MSIGKEVTCGQIGYSVGKCSQRVAAVQQKCFLRHGLAITSPASGCGIANDVFPDTRITQNLRQYQLAIFGLRQAAGLVAAPTRGPETMH
jgi:hypothetical protein